MWHCLFPVESHQLQTSDKNTEKKHIYRTLSCDRDVFGWIAQQCISYFWNISNECSLVCSFSQRTCVCKCLDLFDCSQATSGRIVACKSVEEVLMYSTMINQRARERSWTSHQLQWPKAENPKEKYSNPLQNIIQSLTTVSVNKKDLSWGDLVFAHTQAFNHQCLQDCSVEPAMYSSHLMLCSFGHSRE